MIMTAMTGPGKDCAASMSGATSAQGLTLVHFSAQPKPLWSHLSVSPYLID